jgi:hypothetical protein
MKAAALEESKKQQVIVGTYSMSSEAVNIPSLEAIILATSRKDIEQSIGRSVRKDQVHGEKNLPITVDIMDMGHGVFWKQYKTRVENYTALGYNVHKTKAIYFSNSESMNRSLIDAELKHRFKPFIDIAQSSLASSSSSSSSSSSTFSSVSRKRKASD